MITQDQVVDHLKNIKVGELRALITTLEDELGVKASAPPVFIPGGNVPPPEPEQTEFNVILLDFGPKKVGVIKAVRVLTGLGLKEAKALVEAKGAIREDVSKDEAEAAAVALTEAGGTVEIR